MPGLPENARAYRLKRLPEIGKSIPEILSGPTYKGIVSMGKGTVTLSIIAECSESDYYKDGEKYGQYKSIKEKQIHDPERTGTSAGHFPGNGFKV